MLKKIGQLEWIIIGLILVLVVFGGYWVFGGTNSQVLDNYQYSNGYSVFEVHKVSEIETYIELFIGEDETPYLMGFRNDPLSVEDITVEGNVNTRIFGDSGVFVTIDPNEGLTGLTTIAALEINNILETLYEIPVGSAMTSEYGNYTVMNCDTASGDYTVVYLTLGEETKVYVQDYCIVVMGETEEDIVRATDRMLFDLLGIM